MRQTHHPRAAQGNRATSAAVALALGLLAPSAAAQYPYDQATPPVKYQTASTASWQMPAAQAPRPEAAAAPSSAQSYPQGRPMYATASTAYAPQPAYPQPAPSNNGYAPQAIPAAPAPDQIVEQEPEPPFFDLAVGTQVPLSLGGQVTLEVPGRLLLQGEVGWMPEAYGSALNGILQSWGAYDSATAELVTGVLDEATVVRLSAGWRPFSSAGFEVTGGYTSVSLGGMVGPAALSEIAGSELAGNIAAQLTDEEIEIDSQLHMFHVALGWRWVAWDHLVIRASAGYTQALASSSSIETPSRPEIGTAVTPFADAALDEVYKSYVKLPVLGLNAGYRF